MSFYLVVLVPAYSDIVDDAKWSEGKTAAGAIKVALEIYRARYSDLSSIAADDWTKVQNIADKIRLEPYVLQLRYFNPGSFEYITGNNNRDYEIRCIVDSAHPSKQGGITKGTISYDSATEQWTDPK